MALNLGTVMDAIGTRLATITGLRVFDYPPEQINVPQAVVSLPDTIDFDATAARGFDRTVIPIYVMVSKQSMRVARDQIATYVTQVKAALEPNLNGACDSCRVMQCRFENATVDGVDYLAAIFPLEVYA